MVIKNTVSLLLYTINLLLRQFVVAPPHVDGISRGIDIFGHPTVVVGPYVAAVNMPMGGMARSIVEAKIAIHISVRSVECKAATSCKHILIDNGSHRRNNKIRSTSVRKKYPVDIFLRGLKYYVAQSAVTAKHDGAWHGDW